MRSTRSSAFSLRRGSSGTAALQVLRWTLACMNCSNVRDSWEVCGPPPRRSPAVSLTRRHSGSVPVITVSHSTLIRMLHRRSPAIWAKGGTCGLGGWASCLHAVDCIVYGALPRLSWRGRPMHAACTSFVGRPRRCSTCLRSRQPWRGSRWASPSIRWILATVCSSRRCLA